MTKDTYKCVTGTLGGVDKTPLTEDELRALINRYKRKQLSGIERMMKSSFQNASDDAIVEELAKEARMAAMIKERTAKFNLAARVAGMADIPEFKNYADGLEALVQGSKVRVLGGRESIQGLHRGYRSMYLGQFLGELYRDGVLQAALPKLYGKENAGIFDEAIAIEMDAIGRGKPPGSTKNEAAVKVAKAATKYFDLSLNRMNRLGAWIAKTPGYIIAQSHDMMKLRAVSKQEWTKYIRELLDEDKTFGDIEPAKDGSDSHITEFLGRIYDELSSGLWFKAEDTGSYRGPANLARKVSSHRVLHFKGPKEFIAYNSKYGVGTVFEGIVGHLERAARTSALMERFGPSWRENMNWLRTHFAEKLAAKPDKTKEDYKALDTLKAETYWKALQDIADGSANIPTNVYSARWQQGYLALKRMASLGQVLVASFGDVGTAADELRFNGMSFGGALGQHTTNVLSQIGGAEGGVRVGASYLGVGLDARIASVAARWDFGQSLSKTIEQHEHKYFWLTGMNWLQESNETSMSHMLSHNLGLNAGLAWKDLDPDLHKVLTLYKIGEGEWDVIRKHGLGADDADRAMVYGDKLREAPLESVDHLIDVPLTELKAKAAKRLEKVQALMIRASERIERLEAHLNRTGENIDAAVLKDVRYTMDALRRQQTAQKKLMDTLHAMSEDTQKSAQPLLGEEPKVVPFNTAWRTLRREMEFLSKAEVGIGKKWADSLRRHKEKHRLNQRAEPAILDAIGEAADTIDSLRDEIANMPADFDRQFAGIRGDMLNSIERRLQSYFADRTAVGVPRAGIKEQYALTFGGQRPGSAFGFAARAMMLFKGYGLSFTNEVLGKYGQQDKFWKVLPSLAMIPRSEQMQLVGLISTMTAIGYMSLATKQLLKGRTPPEFVDDDGNVNYSTFGKAMLQGGGFGIYGDFLSGTANRFGQSFIANAAGPAAGDVEMVAKIIGQTGRWADGGAPPDDMVWNLFKANTPYINLFYTRAMLDYLILYDVQESLSPGSLARMEERLRTESGQEFFAPPTENRVKLFTE